MPITERLAVQNPIHSEFRDDPDFQELLEDFVKEVANRRQTLQEAFARGDFDQLKTTAHQLKGAGGGYGFSGLSEVAASLEQSCKQRDNAAIELLLGQTVEYLDRISL
jgi:HPt (histidine-containing phosphotransfer) domain-containing protein